MTTEVLILHTQPGYEKSVRVRVLNDAGEAIDAGFSEIKPGMFKKFYVYEGQNLFVEEMPSTLPR